MLILNNLMPEPLRERLSGKESSIWNRSLQFATGEWIKITAPSGTGKTTLVHMMYALRKDYAGSILLHQTNIRSLDPDSLACVRQQQISIIFQDLKLFPHLTARENIELKRILQEPFCDAAQVTKMAEQLGIAGILDQPARICSYGEQQRICIIRALVQPFEWLIMDEPFSHLDIVNTKIAAALIAEECRKRKAGFVITDLDDDELFPYTQKLHL
ncbi:MAG: ATP-binding cassette domain-containing protein [Sphingobacteriia bacterium]|nr:ATP-binding cassette domain-containing protein [Sphingobacteriia bacterium]